MRGTAQYAWDKLFAIDSSGLQLYAQRQKQDPTPESGDRLSNYYLMRDAELSGDGSVRALITVRICVILGSGCFVGPSKIQSELSGLAGQGVSIFAGQMRMSRNGRYAFVCCDGFAGPTPPTVLDLTSGARRVIANAPQYLPRGMVASSGAVIVATQQPALQVATLSETQTVAVSAKTVRAVLDDSAATAVYEGQPDSGGKLLAQVDLRTGAERPLVQASDLTLVGVTNDGAWAAFLSSTALPSADTGGLPQLFVLRTDGTGLRQMTQDPAGLVEATLARNGAVAYAVTAAGRLLKIDVASGVATELIGRTLTVQGSSDTPVAGSAYCIGGTGLTDAATAVVPPLPASLGGLQLLLDGSPVPLQSVAPGLACFQLPWETAMGTHSLTAVTNSTPLFEALPNLSLLLDQQAMAHFVPLGPDYPASFTLAPYPLAAHQDFSSLITRAHPARPGEIIHLYMTGLGPVSPPLATGAPAPANPPAATTTPLACWFSVFGRPSQPAQVLFAGLAPGFAGYYQVDVRIPRDVPVRYAETAIVCNAGKPYGETAPIPLLAQPCPLPGLTELASRDCVETHVGPNRQWE